MSKLQTVRTLDHNYYVTKGQMIMDLGYNNPNHDTDERQRDVWKVLKEGGYELEIVTGYDCSTLGSRESEYYQYFQTRAPGEEDVAAFYEEFYILEKAQKRIIFAMRLGGKEFVFVGNKRTRAHEIAIKKGFPSRCAIVVVDRPGMTDDEKCALAHQLARRGNKQEDSVRDETEVDYQYQLSVAWKLHCKMNPAASDWTEEQKVAWGKKWVISNISQDYAHRSRKSRLTRLVNAAFGAAGRGTSLPMPEDATIEERWKEFYGSEEVWDPTSRKVSMLKLPTRFDLLVQTLYNEWKVREEPSRLRKSCWVVVRAGNTLDANITQLSHVEKERTKSIEALTKFNINPNHSFAGFPLVKRVMFAKQMNLDDYEAWEWNEATEAFNKKPGLGSTDG